MKEFFSVIITVVFCFGAHAQRAVRSTKKQRRKHYAPFPGHRSVPDFMKFYNDPYTLFENDLKNIYDTKSKADTKHLKTKKETW